MLKIVSFNILDEMGGRTGWKNEDGKGRYLEVIKTLKAISPDIAGLQEDQHIQDLDVQEGLGDGYAFFGVGGEDGKTKGRHNSIVYRKDRFTRLNGGTIWLSDTPETPGSHVWSDTPRTATWVILREGDSGPTYFVLNAHWCNGAHRARIESAKLVRERIAQLAKGLTVIVTGDLNSQEDSPEILDLLGKNDPEGIQLTDSHRHVFPEKVPEEGTTNGVNGPRIDYVLYSPPLNARATKIIRQQVGSDHSVFLAILERR